MKSRRSTNSQNIISIFDYFPPELLPDILNKLPVKSLLRFRCVSKTFRNTIDNPNFIYNHLSRYNHNKNHEKLHMVAHERATLLRINFTTHRRDTFPKSAQHVTTSERGCWPCAAVDGLILLWLWDTPKPTTGLFHLVNPVIRKYLQLPRCPLYLSFKSLYAVGFARSVNDYKVVAFQFRRVPKLGVGFAVYGLTDGRWRRRRSHVMDWLSTCTLMQDKCVSTKGAAHWLMSFIDHGFTYTHVVSFDFDVEEFSYVELPNDQGEVVWFVFVLGDSVAVLGVSPKNISIWVMDDKDGGQKERPWKKWYSSGDSSFKEFDFFRSSKYGTILYFEESGPCHGTTSEITK